MKIPTLAEVRKAIIVVIGVAGMATTSGLLHGSSLVWVETGIAILTSVVHYTVPNATHASPGYGIALPTVPADAVAAE